MKFDYYEMLTFYNHKVIPKLDILFISTSICEDSLLVGPWQLQFLASCGAVKIVLILEKYTEKKSIFSNEELDEHLTEIAKLPTNFVLVYPGQSIGYCNFNFINYCPSKRLAAMVVNTETNIVLVDCKWLHPNLQSQLNKLNCVNLILEPKKAVTNTVQLL